jgi:hypothetical protein
MYLVPKKCLGHTKACTMVSQKPFRGRKDKAGEPGREGVSAYHPSTSSTISVLHTEFLII